MPDFSVVTLVKGRRKQLANLLEAVKASTILPYDIQIVCMDDGTGIVVPDGLNISIQEMDKLHSLPLAAARNRGIAASKTEQVIFIDVDCLVSPTLFSTMLEALQSNNIVSAFPLYLAQLPDTGNYKKLKNDAVSHPARENIPAGVAVDHLQFWSLIFAMQKQTFETIGGFDESFIGYGAEDTDFAMTFNRKGIDLVFVKDYVLHQYHEKYDPPLNYFDSIIENARRYQTKWGVLPMRRWLRQFEEMELIKVEDNNDLIILNRPSDSQLKKSISKHPY